jgi:hypothetical protein
MDLQFRDSLTFSCSSAFFTLLILFHKKGKILKVTWPSVNVRVAFTFGWFVEMKLRSEMNKSLQSETFPHSKHYTHKQLFTLRWYLHILARKPSYLFRH